MTEAEYTEQALDQLAGLESETADRVLNKVDEATEWTEHRLERLQGWPYYKLRVGDYRVIITWDKTDDVLIVEAVGHRRNVYDRHLPPYYPEFRKNTPTISRQQSQPRFARVRPTHPRTKGRWRRRASRR